MLYSFDIFDTLVTRIVDTPNDIFLLVERIAQETETIGVPYAKYREHAEKYVRSISTFDEITLDEIYSYFSVITGIYDEGLLNKIKEIEIIAEKLCLQPIEANINYLKKLVCENKRVILISDMYLSAKVLRKLLIHVDEVFSKIPIYVSSEYRTTKASGGLYLKIKQIERIEFNEWRHVGDNSISDVMVPEMLGIDARKYRFEKEIDKSIEQFCMKLKNSLCCSIYKKLIKYSVCEMSMPQKMMGFCISAPFLMGYIEWMLEICKIKGYKRLYFVARDGFILKDICKKIIEWKGIDCSVKYIYGSRNAWKTEILEEREKIKAYFNQEIDFTNNEAAFIDVNGTGQSLYHVKEILKLEKLNIFYFTYIGQCINHEDSIYSYQVPIWAGLNEIFCRAKHGKTVGYKNDGCKWIPVLDEIVDNTWEKNRYDEYLEGILGFIDQWIKVCEPIKNQITISDFGRNIYEEMALSQDADILGVIGDWFFSDDLTGTLQYAPTLSKEDIDNYLVDKTSYKGMNFEFSIKRSGKEIQAYWDDIIFNHTYYKPNESEISTSRYKIIIYGAGKKGCEFFHRIKNMHDICVVQWVDINYSRVKVKKISPVKEIYNTLFDYIVITPSIGIKWIIQNLSENGIDYDRIKTIDEFMQLYEKSEIVSI